MIRRLPHRGACGLLALAISTLALVSSTALAVVPLPGASPAMTSVAINTSAGDQFDPHVSGDWAAYTSDIGIRYFDFATNTDAAIPMGPSVNDLLSDISGSKIVFSRVVIGGGTAVMLFDAATPAVAPVEIDPASNPARFGSAIGGDTVAYIDFGLQQNGELVVHDLATGASTRLTNDTAVDGNPQVSPSGDVVVWEHCARSLTDCDIWQAVRAGGAWTAGPVASSTSPEGNPDTNGALVVYDSHRVAGDEDIFMRPVSGAAETRLEMAGFQGNPSIAGNIILFESRVTVNDTADLFVYDIASNRVYQLTNTPLVNEQLNDVTLLPGGLVRVVWSSDEDAADQRNVRGATFALQPEGAAFSFGSNSSGQLGDGSQTNRASPVRVAGLTVTALAGGAEHSLALVSAGTVWAWGRNDVGQLGDGTNANRATPVQVSSLHDIVAIAGGANHNLALRSDGTVWAWGRNNHSQLGDGTNIDRSLPTAVVGLPYAVTGIAAGGSHSLAITRRIDPRCPPGSVCVIREVYAWGGNQAGQLGDGTNIDSAIPLLVNGLSDVAAVSAGSGHSLALELDGTVWSWGFNHNGQLGDGTTSNRGTPGQVPGILATAIAAGGGHSLAISQPAPVNGCPSFPCAPIVLTLAWGGNGFGQLGDGTFTDSSSPVVVVGLRGAAAIAAGGIFSLATRTDGTLWAWGENGVGELGDGTNVGRATPGPVGLQRVVAIAAGAAHGLAAGRTECSDGIDNDGDGKTDLADAGCSSSDDLSERTPWTACDDGIDNDGDGRSDYRIDGTGDLGCYDRTGYKENPACQDGVNNDSAFGTDFDGGESVLGLGNGDPNGLDPECAGKPWQDREYYSVCGIGPELALLLPLLAAARARVRRSRRRDAQIL